MQSIYFTLLIIQGPYLNLEKDATPEMQICRFYQKHIAQ